MNKSIYFDMDGTIADLYNVKNWRDRLDGRDETVYTEAKPLLNFSLLARLLNRLQREGWRVCVCSWAARNSTPEFFSKVRAVKTGWLHVHLKSVRFDSIDIIEYGKNKRDGREGILFDDNPKVRALWGEGAHDVDNIIEILKSL